MTDLGSPDSVAEETAEYTPDIDHIDGDDDDAPYKDEIEGRIFLERADRSLAELQRWHTEQDLDLQPPWQRRSVWNDSQKSKLIESLLLDIPVPPIYLAKDEHEKYEVIDGQQRLQSAFDFFQDRFSLRNVDGEGDLEGRFFSELDQSTQRRLRNTTIQSFELDHRTDGIIKYLVFERLNTGGTKLNAMEIRNCIYRGPLNDLIAALANNEDFKETINQANFDRRMRDREFVLRFLAFYERTHLKYTKSLKSFLNGFLDQYREIDDEKAREYSKAFSNAMWASRTIFGSNGFRLKDMNEQSRSLGGWLRSPNIAVFQCIATSFDDYQRGQLTKASDRVHEEYLDLITTDVEWRERVQTTTGSPTRVKYVFETWRARLKEVMADVPTTDRKRVFSQGLKQEMFQANATCKLCDQEIKTLDDAALDHEKHYWRGGKTIPENARLVHRFCNMSRGGRD